MHSHKPTPELRQKTLLLQARRALKLEKTAGVHPALAPLNQQIQEAVTLATDGKVSSTPLSVSVNSCWTIGLLYREPGGAGFQLIDLVPIQLTMPEAVVEIARRKAIGICRQQQLESSVRP